MLRKFSLLVALILLTIFDLYGCSKKEIENPKDFVYEEKNKELQGIKGDVLSFAYKNGKYYVCTVEEQENEELDTTLYQFNEDGTEIESVSISQDKDIDVGVHNVLVADSDKIYLVVDEYDKKTDIVETYIVMIDGNGKVLNKVNLKKFADVKELLIDAQIDDNGMIAIEFENRICVFDPDLNYKGNISIQNGAYKMSVSKNGTILLLNENVGMTGSEKLDVCEIDTKLIKSSKVASIKYDDSDFVSKLMRGSQYDFYYKTNSGIYGYDLKIKKEFKIMDMDASYLSCDIIGNLDTMKDEKFYDIHIDDGEQNVCLSIYEKVAPKNVKDRITITYGGVFISEEVKKEALNFNRKNKEYQIVFKDYAEDMSDTEDPIEKMNLEIMAGNVPDIIDLSFLSVKEYEKKGLLVDLSEFIEEDKELKKDDFLDNVWDAMLVDDKLYSAASGVYLSSFVGNGEKIGDRTSISINDIYEINQQCQDGQTVFGKKDKTEILRQMLRMGVSAFVDEENKKCDFDGDDFKTLLKFCDENGREREEANSSICDEIESINEGKMFFSECAVITLENIILYNEILGDKVRFVGYPGKEEGYSYFRLENAIGIAANSKHKEVAWAFVRTFLTKEYQGRLDKKNVPLRKDCFEMMKRAYTAEEEYVDELGQKIHPLEGNVQMGDVSFDLRPLTEKELDVFTELIANTKKCMNMDSTITNIICEEAALYFDGKKNIDETVKIIQNRAQTYIDESR